MSLQLIHTSAPNLLDSASAGYGTVARSEKLSKALCARLTALSVLREPRGGSGITGPQFSYNIIDHAGIAWHVLSCVQNAGADYSGRGCHIAHHLVLHQDEIRELLKSALRPTPAGITLALHNAGFWMKQWTGNPRFLTGDPALSPNDLPDAAAQPTWKKLTGHKSNARAFFTPPFERDCLVTVAEGTSSIDILNLFHESDWLTHTRGWGVTYTTLADDADSYAETLRMVTTPGSPLIQRALRTGHPVLNIEKDMEVPLPPPAPVPPVSAPINPAPRSAQGGDMVRTLSRSVSHYHYTEEPDWLLYDIKPARPKLIPGVAAAVVAAGLAITTWYLYSPAGVSPEDDIVREEIPQEIMSNNVQQLADILRSEYNHLATVEMLNKLCSITETCPEDALLLESASLLQAASQPGTRHAASIKRLCECARLLGIKDTELARLYLREATFGTTPDEWKKQFDGQQIAEWITLKQSEPEVIELLKSAELQAFAPAAETPKATILATADKAPEKPEAEPETTPQPGRVSLIPSTAVSGAPIPAELENIIPGLPISVSAGTYVVSCFAEGGELQPARRLNLSENGYRLYITPTEKAGEFLLQPEHVNGEPSPLPPSVIAIRNGRIRSIRTEGREAVVSFPVPTGESFHTNVILASSFGIPLPAGKGITLPPVPTTELTVTPKHLEIVSPTRDFRAPQLKLINQSGFPWELTRSETERIRFTVKLPVLTGHNSMQQIGKSPSNYSWDNVEISRETDSLTTMLCQVRHQSNLPEILAERFNTIANAPCCGEYKVKNSSLTLANLYYITCALANNKLSTREKRELYQQYFNLFAHQQFHIILSRIIPKDSAVYLTKGQASSKHFKASRYRKSVQDALGDRAIRDMIRNRICEYITSALIGSYTREQLELESSRKDSPVFILDNISIGAHVELIWQFRMKLNEK